MLATGGGFAREQSFPYEFQVICRAGAFHGLWMRRVIAQIPPDHCVASMEKSTRSTSVSPSKSNAAQGL